MEDDKKQANDAPAAEFAEGYEFYVPALVQAWTELAEIAAKEKELAYRKAKLNDTVAALKPLVFKRSWDINTLSLSDAIRFVFSTTKRKLTAMDMRSKLLDLGYNIDQFDNPLANIHTALKRMHDTDEISLMEGSDKKVFEATPELKPVPEPKVNENSYADAIAGLTGLDMPGRKLSDLGK